MIKCPHCKGLLDLKPIRSLKVEKPDSVQADMMKKLTVWLDTPVSVSTLLLDMGYEGDLARYEPLDRLVYRTAFRTKDFLSATGFIALPEYAALKIKNLPRWSDRTVRKSLFGVQGRYWLREGYEDFPGMIDAEDFTDYAHLI